MYAGAMVSLTFLFFTLVTPIRLIIHEPSDQNSHPRIIYHISTIPILVMGCTTWLGSWLFWAGYVHLAGNT